MKDDAAPVTSAAEEIAHVETAAKFARWALPHAWKDFLILFDHELSIYFGWPVSL